MTHRVSPFAIVVLLSAASIGCGGDEPKQEYPAAGGKGGSTASGGTAGSGGSGGAASGSGGAASGSGGDTSMGGEGN